MNWFAGNIRQDWTQFRTVIGLCALVLLILILGLAYSPVSQVDIGIFLLAGAIAVPTIFIILFKQFQIGVLLMMFILPFENLLGVGSAGGLARYLLMLTFISAMMQTSLRYKLTVFNRPIIQLLTLFVIWAACSLIWSVHTGRTLVIATTHISNFSMMLTIAMSSCRWLPSYWIALMVSCVGTTILGPFLPRPQGLEQDANRFTTGGQDPNDLSGLFLIVISIALYGFYPRVQSKRAKVAIISGILCLLAGIVLSASRSGAIAILVAILPAFLQKLRKDFRWSLGLVFLIAITYVVAGEEIDTFLGNTILSGVDISGGGLLGRFSDLSENNPAAARWDVWVAAAEVIKQHFFLGIGAGALPMVVNQYALAALPQSTYNAEIGVSAHNILLSVWSETGIIGAGLFMTMLAIALKQAFQLSKRMHYGSAMFIAMLIILTMGITLTWEAKKIVYIVLATILILQRYQSYPSRSI
jgi:O-antigen ligase